MTSIDPSHPLGGDQRIIRATVQRIEDKLRDSQEQIARIVDSAMDAIVAIDDDQRIVVFNPAAEQMFRCAASDAVGTSLERFIQRITTAHTTSTSSASANPASRI